MYFIYCLKKVSYVAIKITKYKNGLQEHMMSYLIIILIRLRTICPHSHREIKP